MSGWEWTEYDSCGAGYQPAEPSGDFTVALDGGNDPVVTNVTRYIGGFGGGPIAQQTVSGGATTYRHGDLTGSAQLATDGSGAAGLSPATLVYTAFGEHVTAGSGSAANVGFPVTTGSIGATRYHYAGAHGYESGLLSLSGPNATLAPITLQHVGARWYQPGIGRFVQRDPIGLRGGWNVYVYCRPGPIVRLDPSGLSWSHIYADEDPVARFVYWLTANTPVSGGYVGVSRDVGVGSVGVGFGWTIHDGWFFYCIATVGGGRGRPVLAGWYGTAGEEGIGTGPIGGVGGRFGGVLGSPAEDGWTCGGGTVPGGIVNFDLGAYGL